MLLVEDLCKSYGKLQAVNHLSFEIKEGSIFGFVGPNGAGKTSTMKIISTLLKPTSGKVLVAGEDVGVAQVAAFGIQAGAPVVHAVEIGRAHV